MNRRNKIKDNNLLDNIGGSVGIKKSLKGVSADKIIKEAKSSRFKHKQDLEDLVDSKNLSKAVNRGDNEFVYLDNVIKDK